MQEPIRYAENACIVVYWLLELTRPMRGGTISDAAQDMGADHMG